MYKRSSFLALVVVLSSSCGSGGGGSNFNLISLEDEWRLGEQLSQDIARQVRLVNDPQALAYVNNLGRALVAQTEMAQLPWQFHIVDDPAINAFAIPGGHVYVNRGLIRAADNASELAGVMGHEIAHGVARHATEQISRQYGLSVVAALVLGQNPSVLQELAAQIVAGGTLARFSREAENEADALGLRYMAGAGYNPRGMVTMFQRLLSNRQSRPSSVEQFFATHPLTEDRIRNVERMISNAGNPAGRSDDPEFQSVKARM